jgi:3-dehydroquinate synthase
MQSIMQDIQVTFRYPVHFTENLFASGNPLLRGVVAAGGGWSKKVLCVVDDGVAAAHPSLLADVATYCDHSQDVLTLARPPLLVAGGERVKSDPRAVAAVQEAVHAAGIDRHAYVLGIGGGAVLDMVGYAAATAHRGVRLIRVPTTVLAQNDSGVGVKNGVNAFGKKNFLGTFAPPVAVLNDFTFLATLGERDWRSGIAEAVKVAALKDAAFFRFIEDHADALAGRDMSAMRQLVYRCAQLHLEHIATSGDPFEFGSSRPLDFGHWAAHKLEQLSGCALRHGEAVALGIALDSTYAHLQGLLPERDWRRILDLLLALGFAIYVPQMAISTHDRTALSSLLSGLNEFREHLGGRLAIMLLRRIGVGLDVDAMDAETIVRGTILLREYQQAQQRRASEWLPMPAVAH